MTGALLERISHQVHADNPRKPDESIDAWLKRTWVLVLEEYEKSKPPLPLVQSKYERSQEAYRRIRGLVDTQEDE